MIELIDKTVKKLNGDIEHDQYILMDLMIKLKINPNEPDSYHYLYLVMCEEIGILIDDLMPNQTYFEEPIATYIKNLETIQDTIQGFYIEQEEYSY